MFNNQAKYWNNEVQHGGVCGYEEHDVKIACKYEKGL